MSEGEIKVFNITGEAAKAYSGGTKKKRVTRKKGGDEDGVMESAPQPVPKPVINLSHAVSLPITNNVKQIMSNTEPTSFSRQNAPAEPPRPVILEGGDDKKIKVELKKKHAAKSVQLHPKKDGPQKVPVPKKSETRKKNRKVLLGVSSLHKRMTRAKKMHKKVKEMPLDVLRDELIHKKLIKATSKAPESILRQIATDAQIMETKSL